MKDILLVVDMQNDFIDGALGTPEAVAIVPKVVDKIRSFAGDVICTRDTHFDNYAQTQEGKYLPVPHCIKDTPGWQLAPAVQEACDAKGAAYVNKLTFGSRDLPALLQETYPEGPASVHVIGLCTDFCVISNALLLKAFCPEVPITVDSSCCAGVTPQSHETALAAMKMCQIHID